MPETAEIVQVGQHSIYLSTDAESQLAEARERARVLVKVVNEQGLSKTFGNSKKPHVFVEGWQFLASQFGLIPDVEWTKELDNGWEARACLRRLSDGMVIAHGDGECRRDEGNWKNRDSYAIRSMAQTRAVSKVCRIALSSVMVMAGFNATPAEEMDGIYPTKEVNVPKSPDEPHCPACLAVHGALVPIIQGDRKPFQRCTAEAEDCGSPRTYQGKTYSWAGWHENWRNSVAEYNGQTITHEPREVTFNPDREPRSAYVVENAMRLAGLDNETDAKVLVKPGLILAISEGSVDVVAALGGELSTEPTDEELRVVIGNLTLAEADAVAAAAAKLANERPFE